MSAITRYFASLKGNLLALVSSLMLWKFVIQMVSPYESLYVFTIGGSGVTLGILSMIQMLSSTLLRIPGGYIADKRGRSRLIGLAIIMSGLGYLFYIVAQSWIWLVPGVIFLSLSGLAEPATEAIKADSVDPQNRGRGYAIFNTIPDIPALIAPVIGGYIIVEEGASHGISLTGIRLAYSILLIGVILTGLIRLFFLKDVHKPSEDGSANIGVNMFKDVFYLIRDSNVPIRRLLILGGFFMFCFHLDSSMRAIYAVDIGSLSTVQWGWIVTITSIVSLIAGLLIGSLTDWFGRKTVFIPSVLILGVSTLLFVFSNNYPMFLLARILGGVGLYGRIISFQVLIADSIPGDVRGRVMAVYSIFSSFGSSSAILLSGILYDLSPRMPFFISFLAYIVAALVGSKFLQEPEIKQI